MTPEDLAAIIAAKQTNIRLPGDPGAALKSLLAVVADLKAPPAKTQTNRGRK